MTNFKFPKVYFPMHLSIPSMEVPPPTLLFFYKRYPIKLMFENSSKCTSQKKDGKSPCRVQNLPLLKLPIHLGLDCVLYFGFTLF